MSDEPSSHAIEAAAEIQRNVSTGNWGRGAVANRIQYALNAATAEKDRDIRHLKAENECYDNRITDLEAQITELDSGHASLVAYIEKQLPSPGAHSIPEHIDNAVTELTRLRTERDLLAKTDTTKMPQWIDQYEAIQAENLQYKERNFDLRKEIEFLKTWPGKQAIQIQELMGEVDHYRPFRTEAIQLRRENDGLSAKVEAMGKLLDCLKHSRWAMTGTPIQACHSDCPACAWAAMKKEGK